MGETSKKDAIKLRPMTFFPPFIILCIIVAVSMVSQEHFLGMIDTIKQRYYQKLRLGGQHSGPVHHRCGRCRHVL